ncbi:MAG: TetR/AcrR family transcriptional regulator [Desulfatitalea sp.]
MTKAVPAIPSRSALRRQREKEQRFQTILNAAETLFTEKGYQKTSIIEIADLAEVSVGTVYSYFKNKDDLLAQLTESIGLQIRQLVGRQFQEAAGGLEGFQQAGLSFFENFCIPHPGKVALLFRETVGQSAEVEACRKKIFGDLLNDVENAIRTIAQSENKRFAAAMTPEVMAVCIVGIYERVAYHYLLWKESKKKSRSKEILEVGKIAVRFLMGGVNDLIE